MSAKRLQNRPLASVMRAPAAMIATTITVIVANTRKTLPLAAVPSAVARLASTNSSRATSSSEQRPAAWLPPKERLRRSHDVTWDRRRSDHLAGSRAEGPEPGVPALVVGLPDLHLSASERAPGPGVEQPQSDAQRQAVTVFGDVSPLGVNVAMIGTHGLFRPQPTGHPLLSQQPDQIVLHDHSLTQVLLSAKLPSPSRSGRPHEA